MSHTAKRTSPPPMSAIVAAGFRDYQDSVTYAAKQCIQPRAIFISLVNLWRDWTKIPMDVLHDAICILPCERSWIYSDSTDLEQMIDEIPCSRSRDVIAFLIRRSSHKFFKAFQSMILQKEKQGLVCWVSPFVRVQDLESSNVDPRWKQISQFFTNHSIIDPVRHNRYHPLQLNDQWWDRKYEYCSGLASQPTSLKNSHDDLFTQLEFCGNLAAVKQELSCLTFKWMPMLEIIHQSNPTMVPMQKWVQQMWDIKVAQITQFQRSLIAMGNIKKWDCVNPFKSGNALRYDTKALIKKKVIASLRVPTIVVEDCTNFHFIQES